MQGWNGLGLLDKMNLFLLNADMKQKKLDLSGRSPCSRHTPLLKDMA